MAGASRCLRRLAALRRSPAAKPCGKALRQSRPVQVVFSCCWGLVSLCLALLTYGCLAGPASGAGPDAVEASSKCAPRSPDERVETEIIDPWALPPAVRDNYRLLTDLGDAYTQINAAVGAFGLSTLAASTKALASSSPGDATYNAIENALIKLGSERDSLVAQMKTELYGAAFGGQPLNAGQATWLIGAAHGLLAQAAALAR